MANKKKKSLYKNDISSLNSFLLKKTSNLHVFFKTPV